jgi:PKD repeat protein
MVRVSRVRASRARRLAEKLRLRDAPESVEIQWDTDAPAAGITAGSVTREHRYRPAGTWRVSITVTGAGGETASTARDVVLEAR